MKKRIRFYEEVKRGDLVIERTNFSEDNLHLNLVLREEKDTFMVANSYTDDSVVFLYCYGKMAEIDPEEDLVVY